MNTNTSENTNASTDMGNQVLPVVFNILEKWGCSQAAQMAILGIANRSTLNKYKTAPSSAKVSPDLLERMSYVLNIHKSLRIIFNASDSVYNWVNKPNTHPFFAGRSAMDIMLQGKVVDLYSVASRMNAFRGGLS